MKRYTGKMNGDRFHGNVNTKEVHDLDNEQTRCQINQIIAAGHEQPFSSLIAAHQQGYDNCHWCIGNSTTRKGLKDGN